MPPLPDLPQRFAAPDGTSHRSPREDDLRLPTERELEEARKGEGTLHAEQVAALRRQQELEQETKQATAVEFNEEQEAKRWERFKRKVRGKVQADAERRATDQQTIDAMTPEQYDRWQKSAQSAPPAPYLLPKRHAIALDDVRRDRVIAANRDRQASEERLGIPKMQAKSAERCQKIRDQAAAELAELDQRRQAVRERRERKLGEEEDRCRAQVQAARESLEEAPA